ncbi:MAG: pseudouridine synthase [Spirochaetia bacterium]|nr:pseudouridine synthase [Spirochaetia bacterium]
MAHFSVLFEDDEILLINKPFGTAVQGGKGIAHPLDKELPLQTGYPVYLVHRLDKDTSGILVVAKNSAAAAKWTKLIGEKNAVKEYYAVCLGMPCVNGTPCRKGKLVSDVEVHGKKLNAELYFNVEKQFSVTAEYECEGKKISETVGLFLIHVTLGTGRLHQIRIQLSKAGAPVACDDQHGNFKVNKILRKAGIKKLQLCAKRLTVPLKGKAVTFEIEFPPHFAASFKQSDSNQA